MEILGNMLLYYQTVAPRSSLPHGPPDWQARMARLPVEDVEGPTPRELTERKRRLARAYTDGGFTDAEYQAKRAEIDASLRLTESVSLPTLEEAAQLFENLPQLWREATPEERRKLISPLVEGAGVRGYGVQSNRSNCSSY